MTNTQVWEGWTAQDFIDHLEVTFPYATFHTYEELKEWCIAEQPYYKKHIPEVYEHFVRKVIFEPTGVPSDYFLKR